MKFIILTAIAVSAWIFQTSYAINLEDSIQDFVLETKKLEIPGYPYAFNPSIVRWRGSLLMSFRKVTAPEESFPCSIQSSSLSNIGIVFLFDDFTLDGSPHILNLPKAMIEGKPQSRSEDARLITVDERLYIVYSDNMDEEVTEGGFRMYVGELDFDGDQFILISVEAITNFPGQSPNRREKNWVPFDYCGNIFLSYYIQPHTVLFPHLEGTQTASLISSSSQPIFWNFGELRGGTPALRCGNEYLAFFHSSIDMETNHSKGEVIPHYFMGAYTFEKHPPFAIKSISPEPIIGKSFYEGKNYIYYWKPVQVVFPCGYIMDDDFIWISYGRQDHEVWLVKIDKKGLLKSLIPVTASQKIH